MNKNSAFVWLPAIEQCGVRSPRTILFPYDHIALVSMIDGGEQPEYFNTVVEHIQAACQRIGYPCFLRTDRSSAKHEGPKGYLATDPDAVRQVLYNLLQDNEMKFFMTARPMGIMVREFLHLDAAFTAFDGLPIAREWRLFIDGEHLLCAHPYWPHFAIMEHNSSLPDGWVEMLNEHHIEPGNMPGLARDAVRVAKVLGGEWSADFACDKDGSWWLTDMATAEDSYHFEGCARVSAAKGLVPSASEGPSAANPEHSGPNEVRETPK